MPIKVEPALEKDAPLVAATLLEAAQWLQKTGREMWLPHEVALDRVFPDVANGHYYIARSVSEVAGVVKFQLSDQLFWPDVATGDSAFIHRLAVRRRFAGLGVSRALVDFAAHHAGSLGLRYLRLDCAADRPTLCAFYDGLGFQHHSNFQAGPWNVARYQLDLSLSRNGRQRG